MLTETFSWIVGYPHLKARHHWGSSQYIQGLEKVFQGVHGYVKPEKKFSLEQCVFIPLPKERGMSDSVHSTSNEELLLFLTLQQLVLSYIWSLAVLRGVV